jgi:hypothetical protein
MSKVELFKKWCAESQGHPPQIKAALEAIVELEESISDTNISAFGDGWYDGFIDAQKLAEKNRDCLEDINEDEIREMSEHAESKHAELRKQAALIESTKVINQVL